MSPSSKETEVDAKPENRDTPPPDLQRGMTDTIIGAAIGSGVGAVIGPVVSKVTDHLINRPPAEPEPPSQIVLPPGTDRE